MNTNHHPIPIYASNGEASAFLVYPYIYNLEGEWIGWTMPNREVFSILGYYVGYLTQDPRILRKRVIEIPHDPQSTLPTPTRIYPPATIPLAPLMSELSYDTMDVLLEEPELLHPMDAGELRPDMD